MASVTFNSGISSLPPEFIEFVSFLQTELPSSTPGSIEISAIENTDKLHLIDETLMSSAFEEEIPPETKRLEIRLSAETQSEVETLESSVKELHDEAFSEDVASYSCYVENTSTEAYCRIEQN